MGAEQQERRPREGSNMERVMSGLEQGLTLDAITKVTDLTRKQVSAAATDLGTYGYIEPIGVGNFPRTEKYRISVSEGRGNVTARCLPLFRRLAVIAEVAAITNFTAKQVENALTNARKAAKKAPSLLPKPTAAQTSEARRRSHLGKPARSQGREYTSEQLNGFAFARVLLDTQLIDNDLANWDGLLTLYQANHRELPTDFAACLRLEIFFAATKKVVVLGDQQLQLLYGRLGASVDPAWFASSLSKEEMFIADNVVNPSGQGVDSKGFFRVIKGRKFRPVVEFGDEWEKGSLAVDNPRNFSAREQNRGRVASQLPRKR